MKVYAIPGRGSIDDIRIYDFPEPMPAKREILIRIKAAAINPADLKIISGKDGGKFLHSASKPIRLGFDYAGIVEKVGSHVTLFKEGDEVFGFLPYGIQTRQGTFSEKIVVKEGQTARKPPSLTHVEAAAAATAGITAYQALIHNGHLSNGAKILINGASGGVGSFAVQIARVYGAEVTGVCSGKNVEFVKELGANRILDYQKEQIADISETFDIIFDAAAKLPYPAWKNVLKKSGVYITTMPTISFIQGVILTMFSGKRCKMVLVKPKQEDITALSKMLEEKKIKSVVEKTYSLKDIKDALKNFESHSIRGKIGILTGE